jgi:hypothetical protein
VRRNGWFLACLLAACSAAPAAPSATPTPEPSAQGTVTPAATAPPAPSSEPAEIGSALPSTLDGVELHTFAVGEDLLARLAERLGAARSDLDAEFASDHGARFVQMYALRLPGTDAAQLATTWAVVAFPPDVSDVSVSGATLANRTVTVIESASLPGVGTYYLDPRDDILVVVQAFDVEVAAEALAAVP